MFDLFRRVMGGKNKDEEYRPANERPTKKKLRRAGPSAAPIVIDDDEDNDSASEASDEMRRSTHNEAAPAPLPFVFKVLPIAAWVGLHKVSGTFRLSQSHIQCEDITFEGRKGGGPSVVTWPLLVRAIL